MCKQTNKQLDSNKRKHQSTKEHNVRKNKDDEAIDHRNHFLYNLSSRSIKIFIFLCHVSALSWQRREYKYINICTQLDVHKKKKKYVSS